jgi:hypothetical protein
MRQAHQAINLLVQRSKDLRTGSNDSVPQGFEVALEVGEWHAQLVGRIDDELATQALLFLQALCHLVEGVSQRDGFLGPLARDAGVILPLGDSP